MKIPRATQIGRSGTALLAPILSGILLGASFHQPSLSLLAWVGLVPLASVLCRTTNQVEIYQVEIYTGSYLGGLVFNLITTDWVRTLDGGVGLGGASVSEWVIESEILAAFWPVTVFVGRTFVRAIPIVPMSIALPIVWACHELLIRQVTVAIDEVGWPFYFVGYSIASDLNFSQLADISGVSTLSMLVACVNGGLWDLWAIARRHSGGSFKLALLRAASIPILGLLASYAYGAWRLAGEPTVSGPAVTLMPSDSLETNAQRERCAQIALPDQQRPDLMLWSESAYQSLIVEPAPRYDAEAAAGLSERGRAEVMELMDPGAHSSLNALEAIAKGSGASIVVGCRRACVGPSGVRKFISAIFVDPQLGLRGYYDKVCLVPLREFAPYHGLYGTVPIDYERGSDSPVFHFKAAGSDREFAFAIAICYDIAFGPLCRRCMHAASGSPDFLVVCSSERVDRTGQLARHMLSIAQIRAIELRRAIVRNVDAGYSGIVDSNGVLRTPVPEWVIRDPTPVGQIPIDSRWTLFVLWGDWLSVIAVVAVFGVAVIGVGGRQAIRRFWRPVPRFDQDADRSVTVAAGG